MEEMRLVKGFTTKVVSKILSKILKKNIGNSLLLDISELRITSQDKDTITVHLDLDAQLSRSDIERLLTKGGFF